MTFRLHIPGRSEIEAPPPANPANPLIGGCADARKANGAGLGAAIAGRISGLAGLATGGDQEATADRYLPALVARCVVAAPRETQHATNDPALASAATFAPLHATNDATATQHAQQAEREAFEERAAIMEFDGGLSRADAEVAAKACITCEFQSRRKTCLEPVLAGLVSTFGIRFCEQVPGAGADCMAYKEKTQ